MVEGDKETLRGLHLLQEQVFFLCQALKSCGDDAIANGDGKVDARMLTGAAMQLSVIEQRLMALVDG